MTTFIDLACGVGGWSTGLKEAGLTHVAGIDCDRHVLEIYRKNHGNGILSKLEDINWQEFKGVDAIACSPSCKSYSQANRNGQEQSEDIECAKAIARAIKTILPQYFFLENVVQYGRSNAFKVILDALFESDYFPTFGSVNFADFGLPQSRKRLVLRAVRDRDTSKALFPGDLFYQGRRTGWHEALADLILSMAQSELTLIQSRALETFELLDLANRAVLINSKNARLSGSATVLSPDKPSSTVISTQYKEMPKIWLVERVGWRDAPKVRSAGEPCWTIRSQLADDGKTGTRSQFIDVINAGEVRTLNYQALARLQSFPDRYQWGDAISTNVKGIGNAVPPMAAKIIAEQTVRS